MAEKEGGEEKKGEGVKAGTRTREAPEPSGGGKKPGRMGT